jgi:hypothetical protein
MGRVRAHERRVNPSAEPLRNCGVWKSYDDRRYTPRSLDDIIARDYSVGVTAAALYLRDCLAAENQRRHKP